MLYKPKNSELKIGALLSYINLGISMIIPFFYTPIMLKLLGQEEYGLYSLSGSVTSYLGLLNLGMGAAIVRYIAESRVKDSKRRTEGIISLFIFAYCILALLVCIVGVFLTLNVDNLFAKGLSQIEIHKLRYLMIIMTLSTAVSFPVSVFSGVAVAYEKYIFRRIIDMVMTIITPILNLIVLIWGKGSIGMAVVSLLLQVAYAPIFMGYCCKRMGLSIRFKQLPFNLLKDIWGFSVFLFLSMIVDMLYWSTDKVLIGALIGSVAVAVYNVGGVFTAMVQNMAAAISNVFGTRVTTMVAEDATNEELTDLMIKVGRIQYFIISFIISGFIVFGSLFIHFWSGDEYQDAYWIAMLTMIPLTIPLIQNIAFNILLARKKHQFRSVVYAVIAIINVVSTYLIIPKYGIIGASVCTSVAFFIGHGLVMNIFYYKVIGLGIPLFWKNILRMSVVPIIFISISVYLINTMSLIATLGQFICGVFLYSLLFMIVSWNVTLNVYEKELLKSFLFSKKK